MHSEALVICNAIKLGVFLLQSRRSLGDGRLGRSNSGHSQLEAFGATTSILEGFTCRRSSRWGIREDNPVESC